MANTYTQVYVQFVFAVKRREALIQTSWREDLFKYITGIVKNNGNTVMAINGMPDHVHLFVILKPEQSMSKLMQDVKGCSSKWINDNKFVMGRFEWQSGYGAFSYNKNNIPRVVNYIHNQEEHHKQKTFKMEYKEFLDEFGIEYNEKFVFQDAV